MKRNCKNVIFFLKVQQKIVVFAKLAIFVHQNHFKTNI